MTTDPSDQPPPGTAETWYDAEIAPALADLAQRCHARGMSFLAAVEYQPSELGCTLYLTEGVGLEMRMLHICAATAPNVDRYVIALKQFAAAHGVDTSSSIVLTTLNAQG